MEAKDLVNGTTIFQDESFSSIEYYHVEVKDHSVINANGILAESYFDSDNRVIFEQNKSMALETCERVAVLTN